MTRPVRIAAAAVPSLLAALAASGQCPAVEPLRLTRAGDDVGLAWTADVRASAGYGVFRVDRKDAIAAMLGGPEHLGVGEPLPAFPVLDGGAVATPLGLLFYQAATRCAAVCIPGRDSDGDRLDDCVETGSHVFRGTADTGTDRDDDDTDDDGIPDGDEVLGTTAGLDLPALGASPLRKDIFLEYDWFDDDNDCSPHSHRPTAAQVARVSATFAAAPVANPDGGTGIAVHHDYGQGTPFTGGNHVPDGDGVIAGNANGAEFLAFKAANFDDRRRDYFHYVLLPHRYNTNSGSSGYAEIPGNDLIVSLQCFLGTSSVANTIVHELGHNLSLGHGGGTACNDKPNYNSLMNYRYQFPGIDEDCDAVGDGIADYSRGTRIDLDENDLDESQGVCGTAAIDWDRDSAIETGVVRDLNPGWRAQCGGVDLGVLTDHDDWARIRLDAVAGGDFAPRPGIDCDNPYPRVETVD